MNQFVSFINDLLMVINGKNVQFYSNMIGIEEQMQNNYFVNCSYASVITMD